MATVVARHLCKYNSTKTLVQPSVYAFNAAQVRYKKKKAKEKKTGGGEKFIPRALYAKLKGATRTEWNKDALMARLPRNLNQINVVDEQPVHFFHDMLSMLREHNAPEMSDNMEGVIEVEAELDMRTDKQTKFKANFTKTIMLPHNFIEGRSNTVLVFCETDEQKRIALESGAVFAGAMDIVKAIEKGEISSYEYTHVISTPLMLPMVSKLRKILKNKYPDMREGSIGDDIPAMVERYKSGKTFTSQTDVGPDLATVRIKLGTLNMTDEQLRENLVAYFKMIEAQRGYKSKLEEYGSFIQQATVSVQGCSEKFYLHLDTYHLDDKGVREWLKSDRAEKDKEKKKQIDVGPKITRPLLEQELYWTLSEQEMADRKSRDWQNRIEEQRRLISMSDKQRRAWHQNYVANREAVRQAEEKYEKKLAEVYRQKRLSRLSTELQEKIDLTSQFRKKVHI